jgi:hypothetical protein
MHEDLRIFFINSRSNVLVIKIFQKNPIENVRNIFCDQNMFLLKIVSVKEIRLKNSVAHCKVRPGAGKPADQ